MDTYVIREAAKANIKALCLYFKDQKPGEFHPREVVSDLGISHSLWRTISKRFIYPPNSMGRKALGRVGVSIQDVSTKKTGNGGTMICSVFVKQDLGASEGTDAPA